MGMGAELFGEVEKRERAAKIARLAWARAEAVRQAVYVTCIKLASQAPDGEGQSVAKDYLSNVTVALNVVEGMCRNVTRE